MIYCVEDDNGIRELVVYTLKSTGFDALGFEDAQGLYEALENAKPELVLLDIMLPGEDGISILKRLKEDAVNKNIPVIMLTAKGTEYDKVTGLECGADDYVTKPFGMMELVARIKAVLRRAQKENDDSVYAVKNIEINTKNHSVRAFGKAVDLTKKEYDILLLIIKNPDTVFTRDVLLEKIWGYDFDGETRTVDVHIRTLRTKLGEAGNAIETVRGVGYRIGEAK